LCSRWRPTGTVHGTISAPTAKHRSTEKNSSRARPRCQRGKQRGRSRHRAKPAGTTAHPATYSREIRRTTQRRHVVAGLIRICQPGRQRTAATPPTSKALGGMIDGYISRRWAGSVQGQAKPPLPLTLLLPKQRTS
jgi:sRNA-binding protein